MALPEGGAHGLSMVAYVSATSSIAKDGEGMEMLIATITPNVAAATPPITQDGVDRWGAIIRL